MTSLRVLLLLVVPTLHGSEVTGVVSDPTGAIIRKAKVTLRSNPADKPAGQTEADRDGKFSLNAITPGVYDLVIDSPGFAQFKVFGIRLGPEENRTMDAKLRLGGCTGPGFEVPARVMALEPSGTVGKMSGQIIRSINFKTSPLTLNPLAGAKVTLLRNGQRVHNEQTVDESGWYLFENLNPAEYQLRVEAPGFYAETWTPQEIRAGFQTRNRPLQLEQCPAEDCSVPRKPKIYYCE